MLDEDRREHIRVQQPAKFYVRTQQELVFRHSKVKAIIGELLQERLGGTTYDPITGTQVSTMRSRTHILQQDECIRTIAGVASAARL